MPTDEYAKPGKLRQRMRALFADKTLPPVLTTDDVAVRLGFQNYGTMGRSMRLYDRVTPTDMRRWAAAQGWVWVRKAAGPAEFRRVECDCGSVKGCDD